MKHIRNGNALVSSQPLAEELLFLPTLLLPKCRLCGIGRRFLHHFRPAYCPVLGCMCTQRVEISRNRGPPPRAGGGRGGGGGYPDRYDEP